MEIRPEQPTDHAAVRALNAAAFETAAESSLVDALRRRVKPIVSLVADDAGAIVGHILLSPVMLAGHPELTLMGLAPMAVTPDRQRQGIGSALVRAGLAQCRQLKVDALFVLGHPEFYPRFGFVPTTQFGIGCEYDVPADVFMALELRRGCLDDASGTVAYHQAFGDL